MLCIYSLQSRVLISISLVANQLQYGCTWIAFFFVKMSNLLILWILAQRQMHLIRMKSFSLLSFCTFAICLGKCKGGEHRMNQVRYFYDKFQPYSHILCYSKLCNVLQKSSFWFDFLHTLGYNIITSENNIPRFSTF